MRSPFITTSLFNILVLTIPISLLKNHAADSPVHAAASPRNISMPAPEGSIAVTDQCIKRPLRLTYTDDSLRVDHIIELY